VDYDRFGPYVVHECLGAGGMATVHRATITVDDIERQVALKRLLPQHLDDKLFVADFIREAKLSSQLAHPNIVRVLELGRVKGIYYIAMELVRGCSVFKLMRRAHQQGQRPPIGIVIALISELCDALDYAANCTDANGEPLCVVHRDLSPQNLIVTDDGHLKIIDFGVAKTLKGKFATNSGLVKGKLGYMSVEALAGKPVDARCDVYSAGVVAWELLTGRRLFDGANEQETMDNIRAAKIVRPSLYNRSCPEELDDVVMGALTQSRDARWPSAGTMRRALEEVRPPEQRILPRAVALWKTCLVPETRVMDRPDSVVEDMPLSLADMLDDDTEHDPAAGDSLELSVSPGDTIDELLVSSLRPSDHFDLEEATH
jgi:eukaryotic-like serine/threonine-protein kinase